jgi:hypothetical protein
MEVRKRALRDHRWEREKAKVDEAVLLARHKMCNDREKAEAEKLFDALSAYEKAARLAAASSELAREKRRDMFESIFLRTLLGTLIGGVAIICIFGIIAMIPSH